MGAENGSGKECPGCRQTKPTSEFGNNRRRPDGLAYYCKACFGEISRASYRRRRAAQGRTVREREPAPPGRRWCPDCQDHVPLSAFGPNRTMPTGVASYCLQHQNERTTASRQRLHGSVRNYHLRHRYGVTSADVDVMRDEQDGRCAICARDLGERPHVDHDHATGAVRGLLCFTCNVGLGNFADDVDRLRRAVAYLGRTPGGVACVYELAPREWHGRRRVGSRA